MDAPAVLRQLLAGARSRDEPFSTTWPAALSAIGVDWPDWVDDFAATAPAWRRAYQGEPATAADCGMALLAAQVAGGEPCEPAERECAHCHELIVGRRPTAKFCSDRCARAAAYEREQQAAAAKRERRALELRAREERDREWAVA